MLIASGNVDVHDDELHLGTCGPDEGVGEIIIYGVPRTATVTALTRVEGEIDAPTARSARRPAGRAAAESVAATRLANPSATG